MYLLKKIWINAVIKRKYHPLLFSFPIHNSKFSCGSIQLFCFSGSKRRV